MKKVLAIILISCCSLTAKAQHFDYNFGLQYAFVNNEFAQSLNLFETSGTVSVANFKSEIGLYVDSNDGFKHKLRTGVITHKAIKPKSSSDVTPYYLAYYQLNKKTTWGAFQASFGFIPRDYSTGEYSKVLFSDAYAFMNPTIDGLILSYKEKAFNAEVCFDWINSYQEENRERFQVFSAGSWEMAKSFYFGWEASIYHFAGSTLCPNVVDNITLHPYLRYSIPVNLQKLELSAGWIQKYDRDRREGYPTFYNGGAMFKLKAQNWNIGFENEFYFGQDLMPYYEGSINGIEYGSDLYFGNRLYHTQINGYSFVNRAELYYVPYVGKWIRVKALARFYIGNATQYFPAYRGCTQVLVVTLDLDALRNR